MPAPSGVSVPRTVHARIASDRDDPEEGLRAHGRVQSVGARARTRVASPVTKVRSRACHRNNDPPFDECAGCVARSTVLGMKLNRHSDEPNLMLVA